MYNNCLFPKNILTIFMLKKGIIPQEKHAHHFYKYSNRIPHIISFRHMNLQVHSQYLTLEYLF